MSEAKAALAAWVAAHISDADDRRALSKLVAAFVAEAVREDRRKVAEAPERAARLAATLEEARTARVRYGTATVEERVHEIFRGMGVPPTGTRAA